jgi:hypothetical protein
MDAQAFKDFATLLQNKAADDLRQAGTAFANSPQGAQFGATEDVMNRVLRVEDFVAKKPARPLGDQSPSTAGFNTVGGGEGAAPPPPAAALPDIGEITDADVKLFNAGREERGLKPVPPDQARQMMNQLMGK